MRLIERLSMKRVRFFARLRATQPEDPPEETAFNEAIVASSPELLFAVLPLVVVAIVLRHMGDGWMSVAGSAEWSFGTSILFGQSVVKLVAGVARSTLSAWAPVALTVALVMVLGLVPSIVVLVLVLQVEHPKHPPTPLVIAQLTLFSLSMVCFLVLGSIGDVLASKRRS